MKYSPKTGLYLPDNEHFSAESRPNFPPKLSSDVVAKGERIETHDWSKHTYWRSTDDMPTLGATP